MQVNNQPSIPSSTIANEPLPLTLKEGDVLQATVKEKLPNNEAILQVKGQEVKVKVQGSIQENGRISVQVTDTNNQLPAIKQIPTQTAKGAPLESGLNVSSETRAVLKQAIDILARNKMPVSKNTMQQLASFIEKGQGTVEQKLETISAMAKKQLEFTPVQIKSVHEALHGKAKLNDLLNELAPGKSRPTQTVAKVLKESVYEGIRSALQAGDLSRVVELSKTTSIPENLKQLVNQAKQLYYAAGQKIIDATGSTDTVNNLLQKGESIQNILNLLKSQDDVALKFEAMASANLLKGLENTQGTESSNLEPIMKALKKEPDLQKVFSMIKDDLLDTLPANQKEKLQISLAKAEQLSEAGRELAARQELMSSLTQIPSGKVEVQAQTDQYQLTDDFLAILPAQSKDFIVTQISERLSQMAIDFKNTKRDITRNLQTVESLLQQRATIQAKPLLEATIKQLDNAILKSDMMLYTDMATEKRMLKASTQLAEAKRLLEKGEHSQASKIVLEVKNSVEKLMFKPSDTRVQHFVSKQLLQLELPSTQQAVQSLDLSMQSVRETATGRQMFEHLRNLGFTYESDQAHSLISKGQANEGAEHSLKNALLKLAQSNGEHSQRAEQSLTQLTGQQLLSKTDTSSLQSMMFTIPFLLQDKAEQVKVFVNSKNEQQKVDWENCNLYFLVETKKLGDVGIMLSAVERTLSVTIKNDKPDFKEKIEPVALMAKERLKDIGYNIGNIQFTRFTEEKKVEEVKQQDSKPTSPKFQERGYDFSV